MTETTLPPPRQLRVRPFAYADLPELDRMVHALAAHHGDAAGHSRDKLFADVTGAEPPLRVLIAEFEGRPRGYAALSVLLRLHCARHGMELHHLYVDAEARGQGVGRALLQASVVLARDAGASQLVVATHPDNPEAQAYYPAAGFELWPSRAPRFRLAL
ncbi:hypothetical protein OG2516_14396 [Oceanicola granulosus HTCC2516]|uniref:N-acetyltransferase domain-containing protein n=1 Tax=Oceanicola granulosus (strain ATCC BAA-861 / DSM 15982 / KCTC 12143 / HTCC2516) TaxID=314256 RepID=Q2CEZ8_OCEGH|nr:GNAT family N-acetyltransferase [Oceanicola granulosus]EAR51212.1 hypothetical protein OG2516_14396 [Oceanicola granulosus HTCC2516]